MAIIATPGVRGGPHGKQLNKIIKADTKPGRPRKGVVWPRPKQK